ncbi:hypothetical protein [Zooshikella sp. RANM57]|uniref:hypothetical protein n=1 Tax=Zooshikella sp. RANM57 TaxID=3425863 RepID=UPI003D6DD3CD
MISIKQVLWLTTLYVLYCSLSGCSLQPPSDQSPTLYSESDCHNYLTEQYHQFSQDYSLDQQLQPVPHYPYVRINRILASYIYTLDSKPRRSTWLAQAYQETNKAWKIDIANLPKSYQARHGQKIDSCLKQTFHNLLNDDQFFSILRKFRYPEAYITWRQWAGLYPLTQYFLVPGIAAWHKEATQHFNQVNAKMLKNKAIYQVHPKVPSAFSLNTSTLQRWFKQAYQSNALQLPTLKPEQLQKLLHHYAPVWSINHQGNYDIPGKVVLTPQPTVRPQPVTYTHTSMTRFHGKTLLQLNYIIWFKERPASGILDIYSGNLDGIIWRVTLTEKGTPLIFDSIHTCGCYHTFFPLSEKLQAKQVTNHLEPPLIIPISSPEVDLSARWAITISSAEHHIIGIQPLETNATALHTAKPYTLLSYDELRSLSLPSKERKSLFDQEFGVVSSTERAERWILWPSGVPSPGAMRQWGNHATLFIGQRHFDDPYLLSRLFRWK